MSEAEFSVLDELYFVTSYQDLQAQCGVLERELPAVLWQLIEKGWVKCLADPQEEIEVTWQKFEQHYNHLYYLASKQGLLMHNKK